MLSDGNEPVVWDEALVVLELAGISVEIRNAVATVFVVLYQAESTIVA